MFSIFFYINKYTKNLPNSLDSIISLVNEEVELNIFCDACNEEIDVIFKDINLLNKNISITKTISHKGMEFFINTNLIRTNIKYVWIIDGSVSVNKVIFNSLIKKIKTNNYDIVFFNSLKTKNAVIENNLKDFYSCLRPIFFDKFFNIDFIKSNLSLFNSLDYLSFFYKIFPLFRNAYFSEEKVIATTNVDLQSTLTIKKTISSLNEFVINYNQSNYWKLNRNFVEANILYFVFFVFLKQVNQYEKNKHVKNALKIYIKSFLVSYFPNYRNNNIYKDIFATVFNEWK